MTLPVLFIMTSNHYPMTYGSGMGWLSLVFIALAGIAVRHYFNLRHTKKTKDPYIFAAIAFMIAAMAFPLAIKKDAPHVGEVSFDQVRTVINTHCTACHSAAPTYEAFDEAPSGFMLDTDTLISRNKSLILERAVIGTDMPLGNETSMSAVERATLRAWIEGN